MPWEIFSIWLETREKTAKNYSYISFSSSFNSHLATLLPLLTNRSNISGFTLGMKKKVILVIRTTWQNMWLFDWHKDLASETIVRAIMITKRLYSKPSVAKATTWVAAMHLLPRTRFSLHGQLSLHRNCTANSDHLSTKTTFICTRGWSFWRGFTVSRILCMKHAIRWAFQHFSSSHALHIGDHLHHAYQSYCSNQQNVLWDIHIFQLAFLFFFFETWSWTMWFLNVWRGFVVQKFNIREKVTTPILGLSLGFIITCKFF